MPVRVFLMLTTSLMTSQRDIKFGLLYSCLNKIVTFFRDIARNFKPIVTNLSQHMEPGAAPWPVDSFGQRLNN